MKRRKELRELKKEKVNEIIEKLEENIGQEFVITSREFGGRVEIRRVRCLDKKSDLWGIYSVWSEREGLRKDDVRDYLLSKSLADLRDGKFE